MVNKPRISVVMSVHNAQRYLKESIEGVLRQNFADFEFIIVDDGSTDGSFRIIRGYGDNRIKVIRNQGRNGLTKSLNKALRRVRGEYVARQDADDISLPSRFEEQIEFFERHPKIALLGTSIYIIDEKGRILEEKKACPRPSKNLLKRNEFFHGSVMFKKAVIDNLGGYNELFKHSQDYELWLRIAKYHDIRNLQIPLYARRIHRSSIGLIKTKEQFLFKMLARKVATHELKVDAYLENLIERCGIRGIYSSLNSWEKLLFYEACTRAVISGDLWQSEAGRAMLKVYHAVRGKLDAP